MPVTARFKCLGPGCLHCNTGLRAIIVYIMHTCLPCVFLSKLRQQDCHLHEQSSREHQMKVALKSLLSCADAECRELSNLATTVAAIRCGAQHNTEHQSLTTIGSVFLILGLEIAVQCSVVSLQSSEEPDCDDGGVARSSG